MGLYDKYDPFAGVEVDVDQLHRESKALDAAIAARPEPIAARSTLGEMGSGFKRGLFVSVPEMAGGAIKAMSDVDSDWYKKGQDLQDSAEAIAALPEFQRSSTASDGLANEVLVAGAEGVGQMAPIIAASVLNPYVGAGMAAGMYGGSTYQDTKERMLKQEGIDDRFAADNPNDPRVQKAKATGLATGAVQGLGEGAMTLVGGKFVRAALPSLGKATVESIIGKTAKPGLAALKRYAAAAGLNLAGETITEPIQDEGQAAIERAAGLKDAPAFMEQAADSAKGGFGTALLLAPFGIPSHVARYSRTAAVQSALTDPAADPAARAAAAHLVAGELRAVDPAIADNFMQHAADAIGGEQQTGSLPYALDLNNEALLKPLTPSATVTDSGAGQGVPATPAPSQGEPGIAAGGGTAASGSVLAGDVATVARDAAPPPIAGGNPYKRFAEQPFADAPVQSTIAGTAVEGMLRNLQPVDAAGSKNSLASAVLAGGTAGVQGGSVWKHHQVDDLLRNRLVQWSHQEADPNNPDDAAAKQAIADNWENIEALWQISGQNRDKEIVGHKVRKAPAIAGAGVTELLQGRPSVPADVPGVQTVTAPSKGAVPVDSRAARAVPLKDMIAERRGMAGARSAQSVGVVPQPDGDVLGGIPAVTIDQVPAVLSHSGFSPEQVNSVVSHLNEVVAYGNDLLTKAGAVPELNPVLAKQDIQEAIDAVVDPADAPAPSLMVDQAKPRDIEKHRKFLQRMLKKARTTKSKEQIKRALDKVEAKARQLNTQPDAGMYRDLATMQTQPGAMPVGDAATADSEALTAEIKGAVLTPSGTFAKRKIHGQENPHGAGFYPLDQSQKYLNDVSKQFEKKFKDVIFVLDEEEQKANLRGGLYAIDRLPQGAEQAGLVGQLAAAARVAARGHRANGLADVTGGTDRAAIGKFWGSVKSNEKRELIKWANEHGLMIDAAAFTQRWNAQGNKQGAEHHVYFTGDNRVIKRSLSPNASWLQYFQRLALHNYLFPDVAYNLAGFMVDNGQLFAVVEQPLIEADQSNPVSFDEIVADMQKRGFIAKKNQAMLALKLTGQQFDEYWNDFGVMVHDLHTANVFRRYNGGPLAYIDSIITLDPATKRQRLMERYGMQEKPERKTAKHKAFLQRMLQGAKTDKVREKARKALARYEEKAKPVPASIDDEINSLSMDDMAAMFAEVAAESTQPVAERNRAKIKEARRKHIAKQLSKAHEPKERQRLQEALQKLTDARQKLATKERATGKPERDNGVQPYFGKGDRVQFANGVHGVVADVTSYQTTTAVIDLDYSGLRTVVKNKENVHSYQVRKDNGVLVQFAHFSEMEKETDPAPVVTPAPVFDGGGVDPDALLNKIKNTLDGAAASRAAASRAKKPDMVKKHKEEAEAKTRQAANMQAVFDAWAKQYPEEAAQYQATATPAPAAGGTGFKMQLKETVHTKKGHALFIVKLPNDESREDYEKLNRDAKRTGNGWDKWSKGFQFLDKRSAEQFIAKWSGAEEDAVNLVVPASEEKTIWNDDGTNGPVAITAPPAERSSSEILKATASSGVKGADEALKGLYELFGGKSLKAFPGAVDEDTYRAAKPHFDAALENFRAAGKSLREFFAFLIDQFGSGIQPYVMKYMQEKQQESGILEVTEEEEVSHDNTADDSTGQGSLESDQPGSVSADGGQQRPGKRSSSSSQTDADGNADPDEGGAVRNGGVASKPGVVHTGNAGSDSTGVQRLTTPSEPRTPKLSGDNPGNYRITAADDLGGGTRGDKIKHNLAAIRLVKQLDREGRYPAKAEQAVLVKYVGWGGLKSVFDPNSTKPQDQKARTELEQLLTQTEYFEARQSVLNAHYTSPEIIGSIYKVLDHMGFKGGNVLEPTYGAGNFIGLMPDQLAAASKWYGSELDPITSKIGKFLYPDAQLLESGFQEAEFPYGKFDLAIGNPPFGSEQITDTNKKRAEINRFKIHNYVIAKSGMHLRPGGVMAMVVTSRFMDTANPEARDYLAKQFKFLTAIRLPNDAFAKNAGTEVVTDLVFFQKLMPGESPDDQYKGWLETNSRLASDTDEEIRLNRWFARRPELMLGVPSMQGTMYGGYGRKEDGKGEFTLNARPGQDTAAEIEKLLQDDTLFGKVKDLFKPSPAKADAAAVSIQMNREDIGIGGYVEENGEIFMREDDDQHGNPVFVKLTADTPWTEKQTLGETRLSRIKGMLAMRSAAYELIEAERFDLSDMEAKRQKLNGLYDAFVAKHGFLSDSANASLMADDVKIESGLEVNYRKAISAAKAKTLGVKPQPARADKAAILTQRVYFPVKEITSAANARDGYGISLSERGKLDIEYISGLVGQTPAETIKQLADEGLIFKDPTTGDWLQEDAYLSGNVKAKLAKVQGREGYEKNVEALTRVLPPDVAAEDIFADLGATWIPAEVYKEFADLMGVTNANVIVIPETGTVRIVSGGHQQNDMNVMLQNPDHDVASLINHVAAKQAVVAYDTVDDKRVVNKDRTKALVPMVKRVSATFRDWLMADPRRAKRLTQLYNDTMNTHAPRTYNGKHLKTVGASPAVRLRNSQRNAAWRMLQSPVTMLDHVVGAGKTFTIITGVMERKRLGLSNKAMVVVPNHLVGQWGADFLKLYPGARILATTEKDFAKANRKRLFARIATGNYDAVIVGHSSFGFIPLEPTTNREFIEEEISYLERALVQAEQIKDGKLIRNVTEKITKKRERIKSLLDGSRDDVVTFENMGIDNLVVDESHEFKNLEYSTGMQNITGMGNPQGAKKSFDLYAKIQYLRRQDGAVTFATGTPISNSLVEMYTILRYLNREELKGRNLDVFDSWAKAYASIESRIEYTASQKLKDRQVMATFNNLPELLQLYSEFADVISMQDLKRIYAEQIKDSNAATGATEREEFPIPKVKGGARYLDIADPTPSQRQYMDYLVARANRLEKLGGSNDPKTDNHLWLMNDARKMALDIRLVDPTAPSDPDNKVNRAAGNIKRIYDKWDADKGTQLVFCDLSTPAGSSKSEAAKFIKSALAVIGMEKDKALSNVLANLSYTEQWAYLKNRIEREVERLDLAEQNDANEAAREKLEKFFESVGDEEISTLNTVDTGFSVYDDLKATLIAKGIPANEIRFIHEANTRDQKTELFNMVNSGMVRVLIGSSRKMGAGTNAQERLVALHHMDAPWRPSDVEQREGRIIRQGNVLYERDPEGFEIEIPAYSTRNTFDSVSWQILARKAEMLEDFRSGARTMQNSDSDAASYAEFMAESTGNPAFREKFKLEREIEELESTERNISARRAAGERIVKNADKDIAAAEKALQNAQRDLAGIAHGAKFEVDGKTYADDLTEAYNKALHEYEQAHKEYSSKLLPDYVAAVQAVEDQGLADKEKKAALKEIKKPVEPAKPTLPRLEKTSQAARAALRVSELLDDVVDRGEVEFTLGGSQVVIRKVPAGNDTYDFRTYINGTSRWAFDANNLKHMSQQKLMDLFSTGEIASRVAADVRGAQRAVESTKQAIADAERTLSKLKFEDADKLKAKQELYKAVVEEVNRLEKELDAKREQEANSYISDDSRRFGGSSEPGSFSLASPATSGLKAADLQREFADNPLASRIKVVQAAEDLPGFGSRSLVSKLVEGQYKDGTIYLVAGNLTSVERARVVALGHELTHAGQDAKLTSLAVAWFRDAQAKGDSGSKFQQAAMAILEEEAAKRAYRLSREADFVKAVKEATAVIGEAAYRTGETNSLLNRLLMYVKHFLRKNLGFKQIGFTDKELVSTVADMMRQGRKNLVDGRGPDGGQYAVGHATAENAALDRSRLQLPGLSQARRSDGLRVYLDTDLVKYRNNAASDQFSLASPVDRARDKQLADYLQQQKLGAKVSTMVKNLVDMAESVIPSKLKGDLGKILSNPWFGSEGSTVRRAIVNLNMQRSHTRNELIYGLMKSDPNAGYPGIEGLDNILKAATKAEVKAWNQLIKQGDVQEVQYTDKELKKKGYSSRVIEAYQAFHAIIAETNRVRFEKLKEIALLPYQNESWFDELKGLLDYRDKLNVGLDEKEIKTLTALLKSMKKLGKAELDSEHNPTNRPVDAKVADAYLKFIERLNDTSEPGLVRMAYRHITEYRGEIDTIRNEWGNVKGYAPRVRKDGDWHVSVYQLGEDENGEPIRSKVFMQPTLTEFGARQLESKIKADMKGHLKDVFSPYAEYQVEYGRNTATPGELLADRGKELALEALVNNAFEKAGIFKTKDVDVAAMKRSVMEELAKEIMAQGFSRHGISREKHLIEGYRDDDYQSVLKEFISGMSGWLSKMQYAVEVTREADVFSQSKPDDKVWIHSYYKDSMKNSTYMDEVSATARSIVAVWYLGFKVSSAVINGFQNYTVGQAELARLMKQSGKKGEAVVLLAKAQRDVLTKKMNAEESQVLEKAIRQGTLHAQAVRSMSGLNEQGFGGNWKKFTELAMTPFSWVEQHVNREPAMLAAYRVFKSTPADQFDQAAFDKAEEFVNNTHYVMGSENLPELVRMLGPIGKTAYLFQGYVHNYLLWLAKRARNGEFEAIARSFGAIAVLGGVFALPGGDDLDEWINRWFGVSYKLKFKQFVKENVGKYGTPGELLEGFINHGLPSVVGVNMSRALAVSIPFVGDADKTFGERMGGVWAGMVKKPFMAGTALQSGDYLRAIENLMPEFVANPMRASRQYVEGARTLGGKPIFDENGQQMQYGLDDVVKKTLGFNPLEISKRTELRGHARSLQMYWNDKRSDAIAEIRRAKNAAEIRAIMTEFNVALKHSQAHGPVSYITVETVHRARNVRPDKKQAAWQQAQI